MGPVDLLLRYPLFAYLGRPAVEAWAGAGQRVALRVGQTLTEEGADGRAAHVLLSGKARLSRAGEGGKERSLGVLGPGDVIGEYALLPPHKSTATCRASEAGEAFTLPLAPLRLALRHRGDLPGGLKSWLRLNALVNQFRQGSGLGFLSAPSLLPLFERCREVHAGPGLALQAPGLLDDGWLYIQRGEAVVRHEAGETRVGPGVGVGERALAGEPLRHVVVSTGDTACWFLHRDDFLEPVAGVSNSVQTFLAARRPGGWEFVPQRAPSDCGVAALVMALRGHGLEAAYETAAPFVTVGDAGATLASLAAAAAACGARAVPVRAGPDQLARARLPAVAHLEGGHYVTVFEARPGGLVVGDPAAGTRLEPMASFRRRWSGHLLLVSAGP